MKFIKSSDQFITEGAHLAPPTYAEVELSWKDDKTLPLEVLKTNNSHDVTGFRKIGRTKEGSFQVYYGLSVDPARNTELGNEDPLFKITLDKLKASDILNSETALSKFTLPTANEIRSKKGNINYIVSLGSTAGLSQDLGKIFSDHFKNAKHISLAKYDFDNFEHALDWEYIKDYEGRAETEDLRSILPRLKTTMLDTIDQENTAPHILDAIRGAATVDDLRGILLRANPKNQYHEYSPTGENTIAWLDTPYQIRSSGISFGGSRKWSKTKYATPKTSGEFGDTEFTEAVKQCILHGSTMLFVDDNSRTKEDISKIFDAIIKLAENIIADSDSVNSNMISQYYKRFLAYVLIYVPEANSQGDNRNTTVKKLASTQAVNQFRADGLAGIQHWIKNQKKK